MDRKKKRDKSLANGSEADSTVGQLGDAHPWLRETEQGCLKKLATAGGPNCDNLLQTSHASLNWSYTQQQTGQQTSQQSAHASMPQPYVPVQQQPIAQQGLQGGTHQPLTQPASGLQNSELPGQSSGAGHFPFHPGSADYGGPQGIGGMAAPYNYTVGFGLPPPPYSGLWDPMSWWVHNAHHQAVYPYSFPGYGSGYAYPLPPTPPGGTNQRGFIKPPPGLSQKHQRLWEAQSMENVQLWATITQLWGTVARAEAEISCQRGKILKLEGDFQALKAHHDTLMEASIVATAPQPARKGRRRKPALGGPIAIVGLPASQPTPLRAQGRKTTGSKASVNKVDLANNAKEFEPQEKDKATCVSNIPEVLNRVLEDQDEKSSSLTVGLSRSESGAERISLKYTPEGQGAHLENHRHIRGVDNLDYDRLDENKSFRPNLPIVVGKDSNCEQSMEKKEAPTVGFLKSAGNVDKQAVISGDSTFRSETLGVSRRDDWSGADGSDTPRNAILRAQMKAHYDTNGVGRSNAVSSGKSISGWQYPGDDGSDEQDDVVASVQEEEADDDDDDDETTLDDVTDKKIGNYMVVDSTTAMSKEITSLSRW